MRLRALDGLRGLAAVIVLMHHTFECLGAAVPEGLQRAFLVLGQQSVWLFFILSGLVLGFQAESFGFRAANYIPSRLARLYLPSVAAVLISYASVVLIPRHESTGNLWIDSHPSRVSLNAVLSDLTLVNGTSGNLMPLWSLKWEVLFSLFLLVFLHLRAFFQIWVIIPLIVVGSAGIGEIAFYGAMFLVGLTLAFNWQTLSNCLVARPVKANAFALIGISQILVSNTVQNSEIAFAGNCGIALSLIGMPMLIVALPFSGLDKLFSSPIFMLAGKVSFSLYLVHEPILLAFARLGHLSAPITIVSSAASLGAAWVFYKLVESRAHAVSRRLYGQSQT